VRDAEALPEIIAMMTAAGRHDVDEIIARANAAEAHLGKGFHQARIDLSTARGKARDRDFEAVWIRGQQATRLLTHAWPPDPSLLPPYPTATPFGDPVDCGCGFEKNPPAAKFCGGCGTGLR
jgi:hypothetical protein